MERNIPEGPELENHLNELQEIAIQTAERT
jgi:hypothetical protein